MRMFMAYYIGALFVAVPIFALGYWYGYWVCARQAEKRPVPVEAKPLPPVVREAEAFLRTL